MLSSKIISKMDIACWNFYCG